MHESSGDPNAVNLTDSNAQAGTPSKGLMQCIHPTFDRYHKEPYDNIFGPVDSIIAGTRYAIATYGSLDLVPGVIAVKAGQPYVGY
jgi:SLT domain-containing protein